METELFISNCKTKFICTAGFSPCFRRPSHDVKAKIKGLDLTKMQDKTAEFYFKGKGKSINEFLNN